MAEQPAITALYIFEDRQYRILSPAVGYFVPSLRSGVLLAGSSCIGKLKILNTAYDLCLPEKAFGYLEDTHQEHKIYPVEYGQELLRLNPGAAGLDPGIRKDEQAEKSEDGAGTESGIFIRAFSNGIFYARPSPDSSPYVEAGQTVEKGKILGLIEVMKTFHQIIFQGGGDAGSAKIKKILVEDTQEVKEGQPLFFIE